MDKKKERVLNLFLLLIIIICTICLCIFGVINLRNNYMTNIDDTSEIVHVLTGKVVRKKIKYENKEFDVLLKNTIDKDIKDSEKKSIRVNAFGLITDSCFTTFKEGNYKYEFKYQGKTASSGVTYDVQGFHSDDNFSLLKYDSIKIKDYKRNKEYDITKVINNIDRSIFYMDNSFSYDSIKLFEYKNHLILAILPKEGAQLVKKDVMLGYTNKDMTQQLIKDFSKILFVDLDDNNKSYEYDYFELLHRNINPYQQLINNSSVKRLYCNETSKGDFQLFVDYLALINCELHNKIIDKNIDKNTDSLAVEINKDNYEDAIKIFGATSVNFNYKNIVIYEEYSIDGKKHIINTKEEFKRYIKC